MPIYEFICQSCGNEFEQIQSFSDSSVPACARCGSSEVVRRMGRPAIHFKGSGWYVTDSKKKGDKSNSSNGTNGATGKSSDDATSSEAVTESKSEGSSDGKVETKAEPKTDSKSVSSTESKSTPAPVASD